jgi:predicted nucleic acid-binding protein
MSGTDFLDTNLLVYAYDARDPTKQARAQALVRQALAKASGVISTQVLGEFYSVVTRKFDPPLQTEEAAEIIGLLARMKVVPVDLATVMLALQTASRYRLSYWDALVVASASRAGCIRLLTEDLSPGQRYLEVEADNPFV